MRINFISIGENVEIYVELPEEGSPTIRPTMAVYLGEGLYEVLSAPDYDPEDEVWEFPPGSIVRVEKRVGFDGKEYLHALKP